MQITRSAQGDAIANVQDSMTVYASSQGKPRRGGRYIINIKDVDIKIGHELLMVRGTIVPVGPDRVPCSAFHATRERTRVYNLCSPCMIRF